MPTILKTISLGKNSVITDSAVMEIAQQKIALYDKGGEQHYDIISAFIKSMRGSDPNGAVYWLSRMIAGGEDVKFIVIKHPCINIVIAQKACICCPPGSQFFRKN